MTSPKGCPEFRKVRSCIVCHCWVSTGRNTGSVERPETRDLWEQEACGTYPIPLGTGVAGRCFFFCVVTWSVSGPWHPQHVQKTVSLYYLADIPVISWGLKPARVLLMPSLSLAPSCSNRLIGACKVPGVVLRNGLNNLCLDVSC